MAAIRFWLVVAFENASKAIDTTGLTTVEFLNQAQEGILIAAPAEYVLVAGLMICLASFRFELLAAENQAAPDQQTATVLTDSTP